VGTSYTIGEVAGLAGTTVRTLHHYDRIGLLSPTERGDNGYRRYLPEDLERLQTILFYRELDLGLERIAALLDGEEDPLTHLRRQHALLLERRARLDRLVTTLETTMDARRSGVDLTPEEQLEVFGDFDPAEHAAEAEQRWGDTDAYAQSRARTARYTAEDWRQVKAEQDELLAGFAAALADGEPADGARATGLAEASRRLIAERFYDLSHAGHRSLATMYVTDARFTATYERVAEGLARYVHDAIVANAERHGATEDGW
jgi:MerR family transcriptional regulator, thiopeptide resistance regulator